MATWTTTSVGQPVAQPISQQLINEAPVQNSELVYHEYKSSRQISEDLQRGTINIQYMMNGTPDEAWRSSGLEGFQIGDVHPWYPDAFLVRRDFQHHVHNDATGSWTLATFVYQKRPCPSLYEEDFNIALVGYQTWYSQDNPPKLLQQSRFESYTIPYPQVVYRRHWPRVAMYDTLVNQLYSLVGKVNGREGDGNPGEPQFDNFMLQPDGFWLIDGIQAKRLYGKDNLVSSDLSHWEITIIFRGDPWRRHEWWTINLNTPGQPLNNSYEELRRFHYPFNVYPKAGVKFDDLVPVSDEGCSPRRPG